jgi:hypothetical protein
METLVIVAVLVAIAIYAFKGRSKAQRAAPQRDDRPAWDAKPAPRSTVDHDAWEGSFWEVREPVNFQRDVRISYSDANGNATQRNVSVRAFEPSYPSGLIIGHCHMRQATRTFRFDRIRDCVDLETGEVVPDLHAHLVALRAASPLGVADTLLREHRDLLKLLLYMAKADGQMRKAEVDVVARTCAEITGDDRVDAGIVKEALAACDVMTPRGFELACKGMVKSNREQFARFVVAAQEIVATQKTVHPEEEAALKIIAKAQLAH